MPQQELNYEDAMKRLEQLTAQMEDSNTPIDQLATLLKEALPLIAYCREQLLLTDKEIKQLLAPEE